jgi:hypothetical protein
MKVKVFYFLILGTKRMERGSTLGGTKRFGYSNSVLILDQLVFFVGRCTDVCLLCAGFWAGAETACTAAVSESALAAWPAPAPTERAATHSDTTTNLLIFMAALTFFIVPDRGHSPYPLLVNILYIFLKIKFFFIFFNLKAGPAATLFR